jgi:hypothetical protein
MGISFMIYTFLISMCPGVDSASENEYQDIPGGKDSQAYR